MLKFVAPPLIMLIIQASLCETQNEFDDSTELTHLLQLQQEATDFLAKGRFSDALNIYKKALHSIEANDISGHMPSARSSTLTCIAR